MDKSQNRILVVEDEDSLRDMFVLVFEDEEYQVDAAANGLEAWELMTTNHYDLLMTDMFMPQMNGIELIQKCQNSGIAIKIILICGGGREFEADPGKGLVKYQGQEINVDTYLKKPCRLDEIMSVAEKLLQK